MALTVLLRLTTKLIKSGVLKASTPTRLMDSPQDALYVQLATSVLKQLLKHSHVLLAHSEQALAELTFNLVLLAMRAMRADYLVRLAPRAKTARMVTIVLRGPNPPNNSHVLMVLGATQALSSLALLDVLHVQPAMPVLSEATLLPTSSLVLRATFVQPGLNSPIPPNVQLGPTTCLDRELRSLTAWLVRPDTSVQQALQVLPICVRLVTTVLSILSTSMNIPAEAVLITLSGAR